jgi:hypothetical protein
MARTDRYAELLSDHRAAVEEFAAKARAVNAAQWLVPRAEGKWTPAQEACHLILTYQALTRDLLEGKTMRLRGTPWKRRLWRLIGLTYVLRFGRLVRGVTAPREVRPMPERRGSARLIPVLLQRCAEFESAVEFTRSTDPERTITHPMMGGLSLAQSLKFCAMHTRHHASFLPSVAS